MTPEQRREMIVKAALPLVAELGAAVTTAQVARAAAIGEATIFRVFDDKDELLDACLREALDPAHALAEIAAVPLDQPLAARLVEAADALRAHLERMGTVIGALYATGRRGRAGPGPHGPGSAAGPAQPGGGGAEAGTGADEERPAPGRSTDRDASMARTVQAVAELFEPERESLRLPPERLAAIFLGMISIPRLPGGDTGPARIDELVEVLLHGALV